MTTITEVTNGMLAILSNRQNITLNKHINELEAMLEQRNKEIEELWQLTHKVQKENHYEEMNRLKDENMDHLLGLGSKLGCAPNWQVIFEEVQQLIDRSLLPYNFR